MNWIRENEQSIDRASAFASIVFPTPGKSSMIRWPSLTREMTLRRSVSAGACTTRATFSATRLSVSLEVAGETGRSSACRSVTVSPQQPFDLVEDLGGDRVL